MQQTTTREWPESQRCIECAFGGHVTLTDIEETSDHIPPVVMCWKHIFVDPQVCPAFEARKEEVDL